MKKKSPLLSFLVVILLSNFANAQSWQLTGNSNTNRGKNFLGTTDAKPLTIRTKNIDRIRILVNGNVGIGTDDPNFKLDVNGSMNIAAGSGYYIGNTPVVRTPFGHNLIIGQNAGTDLQAAGLYNTTVGEFALSLNSTGKFNTAVGSQALYFLDPGNENTATGFYALGAMEGGNENVAFGAYALGAMSTGNYNVGVGVNALKTRGSSLGIDGGTAVGYNSLQKNTFGDNNTAIGFNALSLVFAGSNNTAIGSLANVNDSVNITNSTAIGYLALITAEDQIRAGNNSIKSIGAYVDWSKISDGRIKKNINTNVPGLSFINKLQPVTYNLDLDAADKIVKTPVFLDKDGKAIQLTAKEVEARNKAEQSTYTGFIAQDVEKAAKSLNYDFDGVDAAKNDKDLYALRYAEFVVPLVKAVQELSKENDELKARLDKLENLIEQSDNAKAGVLLSDAGIEQNVPNPFNGNTIINYYLPKNSANAVINITDINGKLIKSLPLNTTGKGQLVLKASQLSAGLYNYTLVINGKVIDSKKMVIQ